LTNTEKTRTAYFYMREAANSLAETDEQTRGNIIKRILNGINIPMLSLAMPVILNLASSKNLDLIVKSIDDILLE
jgi:hypothetical protein